VHVGQMQPGAVRPVGQCGLWVTAVEPLIRPLQPLNKALCKGQSFHPMLTRLSSILPPNKGHLCYGVHCSEVRLSELEIAGHSPTKMARQPSSYLLGHESHRLSIKSYHVRTFETQSLFPALLEVVVVLYVRQMVAAGFCY
jgi:hypothetical protein